MTQMMYAYNMSCAITEPGKAMARGYAAQEIFGEHSPLAAVFFERAYKLGGDDVKPVASVNPWESTDEGIEEEYSTIPEDEQPASRRKNPKILTGPVNRRTPWSFLFPLGKLNVIKGTGPKFDLWRMPKGIIEVWQTEDEKYRLIYTINFESNFYIGEERTFKYEGKMDTWKMVDYIESKNVANLAPLYGKSISIFNYD